MRRRVASRLVDRPVHATGSRARNQVRPRTRGIPLQPGRTPTVTTPHTITGHLHDRTHRHHLFTAVVILVVEIGLIIGVQAILIHLAVTVGLFAREATETLLRD